MLFAQNLLFYLVENPDLVDVDVCEVFRSEGYFFLRGLIGVLHLSELVHVAVVFVEAPLLNVEFLLLGHF